MVSEGAPKRARALYLGGWFSQLYAFDAAQGDLLWSAPNVGGFPVSAVVANGTVFVSSSWTDRLYAYHLP